MVRETSIDSGERREVVCGRAERGGDAFPAVVGELSTVAFICVFMCNRVKVVFGLVGAGAPLPRWPGTPTTLFSSGVSFTIHEQKS